MRRRLNLKFCGILMGALALLGAGTHLLHGFQVRRNARILLVQADRAEKEDKLPQAADCLSRYLALAPGDVDAYARYALLLADEKLANSPKELLTAFFALDQAVRKAPGRQDVRRRAIKVAMHPWLQRFSDAGEHLDKLLEAAPKDGELEGLRARCYEANGEYARARKSFESAVAHRPADADNYVRLAYLLREHAAKVVRGGEKAEDITALADQTMKQMVEANARSFEVYLTRARYRKAFARAADAAAVDAAEKDVLRAKQLAPEAADVILAVSALAEEKARPEEARASLRAGIKRHPREWRLYQALARLEVRQGRAGEALARLKEGLGKLPKHFDLLWNMAYLLTEKEHKEEARDAIARLRAEGFPEPDLDYLGARLLIAEEQWLQASRLLERAYPQLLSRNGLRKDWFSFNLAQETNLLLGYCYEQLGDADRAASAYGRVLARSPRSAPGHHGLARMRWTLGQLDAAADAYRRLLGLADAPKTAWIELARLLIVHNLRAPRPDWSEVQQVLDRAGKLVPPPAEVPLVRMEMLAAQKEYGAARKTLEEAHADAPSRPVEIWVGLADLDERQGRSRSALAVLDEAEKYHGDRVELRLARARYWARHPGDEARRALDKLTQALGKLKAADQRRLLRAAAGAYLDIGEAVAAEGLWRRLAEQHPSDLGARLVLFDLRLRAGDEAGMQRLIQDIQRIEGDEGTLWRYSRARLLIARAERGEKKGLEGARDLLRAVAKWRSGWSRVAVCEGQIEELLGRGNAALAKYRQAVLLGERDPAVIGRMVQLLADRRLYAEAEQMIQKLRQQNTPLGDLERVAAEIALHRHDPAQAVRLAQKAVPAEARDHRRHVWLGQLLWAAGQLPEADQSFRRALALAEKEPYPWVAYVQFLVQTREKEKAEAAVREAEQKMPRESAYLALAQCFQMLGNKDRARKLFDEALAAGPQDIAVLRAVALFHLGENRREEAKRYLERIIDLKAGKPNEIKEARRALALVLWSGGDYQQSQRALAELGLLDSAGPVESAEPEAVEGLRTRAVVLATQPGVGQRRQAVAILEGLQRRQLLSGDEQLLLARLYESVGDAKKAHSQMVSLLAATEEQLEKGAHGKEPLRKSYGTYLTYAAQSSLGHGRLNEAGLWVAKLEALEPKSFRTLALKARVLAKHGRAADVVPALKALAEGKGDFLVPVAAILEQVGQTDAAQELYEKFAARAKRPEDVLVLARFFGRRDHAEKALILCERAWKTCAPEQVGEAAMVVVYTAKVTDQQCQRVAGWLEDAIARHPAKLILLDQLAAVRRHQGRYQETIDLYRRLLEKDKANLVAMNNLAWLLALRGKGSDALTVIQRAIELGGPRPEALDTRAVIYLTLGQSKKAVADLEDALAETPTAHRYFHLAQAYHQANDPKAALRALQKARDLGLTESTIDPLEQTAYRQVVAALERK
jgi:tetratricopeptide (TPR) repeat protein